MIHNVALQGFTFLHGVLELPDRAARGRAVEEIRDDLRGDGELLVVLLRFLHQTVGRLAIPAAQQPVHFLLVFVLRLVWVQGIQGASLAAEAQAATYDVESGNVTLTGDVVLTQGQNVLTGNTMQVNLESGTAQVQGRVRSVLQPGGN